MNFTLGGATASGQTRRRSRSGLPVKFKISKRWGPGQRKMSSGGVTGFHPLSFRPKGGICLSPRTSTAAARPCTSYAAGKKQIPRCARNDNLIGESYSTSPTSAARRPCEISFVSVRGLVFSRSTQRLRAGLHAFAASRLRRASPGKPHLTRMRAC
jgi:hypothetical protein